MSNKFNHSSINKGDRVKGYASVVQRYVEGEVYYIFSNGLGVLTPGGIVMMDDGEYEVCNKEGDLSLIRNT